MRCGIYEATYEEIRQVCDRCIACLYVCERHDGQVKCGCSTDLRQRVYSLTHGKYKYTELVNPRVTFMALNFRYAIRYDMRLRDLESDFFAYLPKRVPVYNRLGRQLYTEVFPATYDEAVKSLVSFGDSNLGKILADERDLYSQFKVIVAPELPSDSVSDSQTCNHTLETKTASERKFRAPRRM